MPLYEYRCKKCGHVFERIQKFSDKPEAACPECGGEGERQLSAPAVHFKGSGWYITDYARKGKGGGGDQGKEAKGDSGGDASSGEASGKKAHPSKKPSGDKPKKKG